MFLQVSFWFLSRKKKRDGPGGREEGRSLEEEKRDGPGGRKEGRSLEEEKNRDGPWRKRKIGTVLGGREKEGQILKN